MLEASTEPSAAPAPTTPGYAPALRKKASLRESWRIAEASGLDQLSDEAIQALARQAREARKKAAKLR